MGFGSEGAIRLAFPVSARIKCMPQYSNPWHCLSKLTMAIRTSPPPLGLVLPKPRHTCFALSQRSNVRDALDTYVDIPSGSVIPKLAQYSTLTWSALAK